MDRQCKKNNNNNLHMDRQCKKKNNNNLHMDRQCKKTTNNLHMDRQCKKTTNNLHMDRQCKKNNKQFTYGQTVQKKQTIYIWTDSAKKLHWSIYSAPDSAKNNNNLPMDSTYLQTIQKTMYKIHIQWGKKVFSQPPIVKVLPLKKMREACNFHHRYTSTMRDKIRKKNPENHIVGFLKNLFANYGGK